MVQFYVKHIGSKVGRPGKELKGFQRVTLKMNESISVTFPLKTENVAYWNTKLIRFVVEKNKVQLLNGSSSADIRAQQLIVVD